MNHSLGQASFDKWKDNHANLHQCYDEAIMAGSDESTTNTQTVLKVFGKTKHLDLDSSRPSKQKSRRSSSSSNAKIEVLKELVAGEKKRKEEMENTIGSLEKKREEMENTIGSLLNCLQQNGFMPTNESADHHKETSDQHTEPRIDYGSMVCKLCSRSILTIPFKLTQAKHG